MIKFDFIVSLEEANSIFECITEEIINTRDKICSANKEEAEWYKRHIIYLEFIKSKMHNTLI